MGSFRLDRFLTLFFFYPLQRVSQSDQRYRIPILMYHSISNSKSHGIHPYYETATAPLLFEMHMKFLYENGYHLVDLHNLPNYFTKSAAEANKRVVISFDDGFKDFLTDAFATLQLYGFSATVFLPTGFMGEKGLKFKGKECLSWENVRDLHAKGIQFGSHTMNHLMLYGREDSEIESELARSKEKIEMEIGTPIGSFSYPYAFPEQDKDFLVRLRKLLTRNGYSIGVTTKIGLASRNDDIFFLKRLPLNSFDDLAFFKAKLAGAYDWISKFQLAYKRYKTSGF
jgi:peptidoglycan/xylan/chitin deacetylase (PgdA/CDA1 family)